MGRIIITNKKQEMHAASFSLIFQTSNKRTREGSNEVTPILAISEGREADNVDEAIMEISRILVKNTLGVDYQTLSPRASNIRLTDGLRNQYMGGKNADF